LLVFAAVEESPRLPFTRDSLGPILTIVLSVPIAFLFGLGIQGDPSAYIIGLVSLGVLTSLDLRGGFSKVGIGFAISFLASLYVHGHSVVGQGFWPFVVWGFVVASRLPSHIDRRPYRWSSLLSRNTLQDDKGKRRCVRRAGRRSRVGSALKAGSALSVDTLTIVFS